MIISSQQETSTPEKLAIKFSDQKLTENQCTDKDPKPRVRLSECCKTSQRPDTPTPCDPASLPATSSTDYRFSTPTVQLGKEIYQRKLTKGDIKKDQPPNKLLDYGHQCQNIVVSKTTDNDCTKCKAEELVKCGVVSCSKTIGRLSLCDQDKCNDDKKAACHKGTTSTNKNDGVTIQRGSCSSDYSAETEKEILEP